MRKLIISSAIVVLLGASAAMAQGGGGGGGGGGGAGGAGGGAAAGAGSQGSTGIGLAPIGHRQPRLSDVPSENSLADPGNPRNKEDIALDRKIKSICRGC
jgi:hypothetical protein